MTDEKLSTEITADSIKHPFWSMSVEEVFETLKARETGLLPEEMGARQKLFGENLIREKRRLTPFKIFIRQLRSPLILVLVAAGMITIFLKEWVSASVIFAAVAVNTVLGFWQEDKAETALTLLKTYVRTRARVRRGRAEREIDAAELVPGDVIRVSQGDRVPADARVIFSNNLEVDEAVLTGESLPEDKGPDKLGAGTGLGERKSILYSGTLVMQGIADAVVTATGSDTEFGKIAALVASGERERTPLQRAISRFVLWSGAGLAALVLLLFGLGLYFGYELFEMFLISVAIAVSAVPEGLPVALTVILAIGVQRLALRKGVVRRLLAAETLGSTSIILTDKTGTLTQAKMKLTEVVPMAKNISRREFLEEALVNIDVVIENPESSFGEWRVFGRALEVSLALGAAAEGVRLPDVRGKTDVVDRLPFSSEYKFSATVSVFTKNARLVLLGAPEILLLYTDLEDKEKERVLQEINRRASAGERIIGVASRMLKTSEVKIPKELKFEALSFDGLLTFRDPLRPSVAGAIRRIGAAGVRTVIVTGDHRGTAEAVARDLGLIDGAGAVLTGDELKFLKKEELMHRADRVAVFARVTPEDKLNLTKLYKEKGEVVAVTGDGINDAPALQEADIGVAVGSGTDVTKGAADLIILDDNFETLVAAIEEGRRVLDNIRKVVVYLLSSVFDELFLIGGALVMGVALPLNALQILFVNFFSDSFPAIALAFEEGVDGLGSRPRRLRKNLFDREVKFLIFIIGAISSAALFVLYFILLQKGFSGELVRTFIFASFASYTLLLIFSIRSLSRSIFSYNPFSNLYVVAGSLLGFLLTALTVYVPFLQNIFDTVPLPPLWALGVLGVGAANILAIELGKWTFRKHIL